MMVVVNPFDLDHKRWEQRHHAQATVGATAQVYLASVYEPAEECMVTAWLVDGSEIVAWYDPVEAHTWRDFKTKAKLEQVLRWAFYWPIVHVVADQRTLG